MEKHVIIRIQIRLVRLVEMAMMTLVVHVVKDGIVKIKQRLCVWQNVQTSLPLMDLVVRGVEKVHCVKKKLVSIRVHGVVTIHHQVAVYWRAAL